MDEERFFDWTRGKVALPLANLRRLAERGVAMQIRVPLIPVSMPTALPSRPSPGPPPASAPYRRSTFPYHTLGAGKYALLDQPYQAPPQPLDDPALLAFAHECARAQD